MRRIKCSAASQTKPFAMAGTSTVHFCAASFCTAATPFARTSTFSRALNLKLNNIAQQFQMVHIVFVAV
jgi:hypothetical protein